MVTAEVFESTAPAYCFKLFGSTHPPITQAKGYCIVCTWLVY